MLFASQRPRRARIVRDLDDVAISKKIGLHAPSATVRSNLYRSTISAPGGREHRSPAVPTRWTRRPAFFRLTDDGRPRTSSEIHSSLAPALRYRLSKNTGAELSKIYADTVPDLRARYRHKWSPDGKWVGFFDGCPKRASYTTVSVVPPARPAVRHARSVSGKFICQLATRMEP